MPKSDLDPDTYLRECLSIKAHAIDDEFVRTPADLGYWSAQYADALQALQSAKLDRDQVEAVAYLEERERLALEGQRPTEKLIAACVEQRDDVKRVKLIVIQCEGAKARAAGNVEAVRTKRDMIVSLGAHVRAEMQRDPVIREEVGARRRMRDEF